MVCQSQERKSDWGEFLKANCIQHMWVSTESNWIAVLHSLPSMGEATNTFEKAHKHLFYDKDSGNARPMAIAVSDDICYGKLGPILWLSFLHLYLSTIKSDMASVHWWCYALVWLHTVLCMSYSFCTEDITGMSCEIGVLFLRLSTYTESL